MIDASRVPAATNLDDVDQHLRLALVAVEGDVDAATRSMVKAMWASQHVFATVAIPLLRRELAMLAQRMHISQPVIVDTTEFRSDSGRNPPAPVLSPIDMQERRARLTRVGATLSATMAKTRPEMGQVSPPPPPNAGLMRMAASNAVEYLKVQLPTGTTLGRATVEDLVTAADLLARNGRAQLVLAGVCRRLSRIVGQNERVEDAIDEAVVRSIWNAVEDEVPHVS